jgi:hypothetical protein
MAQTTPWHSLRENIHHNNDQCDKGTRIAPESLRQGTAGKPLCEECRRLNAKDRGT